MLMTVLIIILFKRYDEQGGGLIKLSLTDFCLLVNGKSSSNFVSFSFLNESRRESRG